MVAIHSVVSEPPAHRRTKPPHLLPYCGCAGAITAPRCLVKLHKEESFEWKILMRARKSKDKFTPWKKLDGNEFGIQNSMNLHVWFPISSGKEVPLSFSQALT
ncbi:hypothetical protein IGI04_013407 [Brassica rapa subsp. trilocularis]|uniref:DUF4283 domain-containing protein n=1 Tax=Brassica rapa subsp. trilocularis TaxID=1813537 RepID=A0ABQ7N8T1_BRACM|nr:hypothetical protein IGI04_013407 [Brassica rapa subsp. trilocularis]